MASRKHQSIYVHLSANQVNIVVDGARLKVSPATSLRWRTLEEAFRGCVSAVKEVFCWIAEREAERTQRSGQSRIRPPLAENSNPVSMDDALVALGIVVEDIGLSSAEKRYLRLQPWAVQLALDRKTFRGMSFGQTRDLRDQTLNADTLCWPDGLDVG